MEDPMSSNVAVNTGLSWTPVAQELVETTFYYQKVGGSIAQTPNCPDGCVLYELCCTVFECVCERASRKPEMSRKALAAVIWLN